MQTEQSRDDPTHPEMRCLTVLVARSNQRQQKPEEQDGIGGVERDVDEVVSARVLAEQGAVQRVRHCCQRMPVRRDGMSERPFNSGQTQTGFNLWILGDVFAIVDYDELESACLGKNEDYAEQE